MAVLSKGTTYASGDQVTATNLNNLVDLATFAAGAVDGVTTQLSGGAIIVKDGGITPAKLSAGGPTWAGNVLTITQGINVGGDAQPGMPVNISGGSTGPILTFKRSGVSTGTIRFDSNFYEFDSTTTDPIVFKVNGTERARVTATGINSTAIGATTPASGVFTTLRATGDNHVGMLAYTSSANAAARNWAAVSNSDVYGDFALRQSAALGGDPLSGTVRLYIDETGNVGIGTTAPGSKLSIVGLPTSAAGLAAGDVWDDAGTLKIVQ